MSKYIKLEDAIDAIEDKIAEYIPTLYGRYAEIPLELRMAIEHLPTIEVSEDCISRKWLKENAKVLGDYYENTVWAVPLSILEDAPSVVPTAEKSSIVENKCDACCQYKIGFEDGKLEMIQMIEDALKGKSE